MNERLIEVFGIKNKYSRWIIAAVVVGAITFSDSWFFDSIFSGVLLPICGIFLGPAAVIGSVIGDGIAIFLFFKDVTGIIGMLSAFILTFVPWLFRKFLRDKNNPMIILKYYLMIMATAVPVVALCSVYYLAAGYDSYISYELAIGLEVICTGYAVGLPLYYLLRGLLDKDLKKGNIGVNYFCIYMPVQLGICIWFALKVYSVSTPDDIYESWRVLFIVLAIFFICVAVFVWLFAKRKRLMLNIFTLIIVASAVYNIITFDTGFGTYVLIAIAVWLGLHAVFFNKYENKLKKSKGFKGLIRVVQIVLFVVALLVVALNASVYVIPEANGDEKGMIILGAPVNDNKASDILIDRVDTAADFLNKYTEMPVIATGGTKEEGKKTEAQVITEELEAKGVSSDRIFQESDAKTTEENFRNCAEIISDYGGNINDRYIITTSMFHLLRAGIYAKNAGFTNIAYLGAQSFAAKSVTWYIREVVSILPLMFR